MTSRAKPDPLKIKIFLVDDHPLVREWLSQLISREGDLAVCGEAEDAPEALLKIEEVQPNIVIVDISLKNTHGLELVKDLQARMPALPVLVLSMHDESLYAERALRAGASGYIMKAEATEAVLGAIRHVLEGGIHLSQKMSSKLMHQLASGRPGATGSLMERLSDRELEVFSLIGQGRGTRQIAEQLHLSVKTIESHRAHIKEKLNLKNATELVHRAIQMREDTPASSP